MSTFQVTAEPGSYEIATSREFAATPVQLLRAHIEADLLIQWLGPCNIEEYDAHNGGLWRYSEVTDDGPGFAFHGVFQGDPSVETGIVQTVDFEPGVGMPTPWGHPWVETVTFEVIAPGRTLLRGASVFQTVADRDAMIDLGMETGVSEGYERLDALLVANAIPA